MKKIREDIKQFIIKNGKWIILVICIILFLLLAKAVFYKEIIKWDVMGREFVSHYLISDVTTPIVKHVTNFGGATYLIIISIILAIIIKNKKISFSIICNLIMAATINYLLKGILQRQRPEEFKIINEAGYSFPSGHSMVSMAFYGFIIYLIYKHIKNKYIKWTLITTLSILIIFIGISRIYLGVHYTSDVIAGFLIAISYLIIFIDIIGKSS